MATADTFIKMRIDRESKEAATAVARDMGMTMSQALRFFVRRMAAERRFPLDLKIPNTETRAAIAELEAGEGTSASSVDELMAQLEADD